MGEMGNTNSFKLKFSDQEINRFSDETGFTVSQLTRLYERFEKLDLDNKGYLEREDLLSLPELNVNPLSDRIIHAFFTENPTVKESEKMQFQDFIHVLAHFMPISNKPERNKLNSKREKLAFSFKMYDLDGNGQIDKLELVSVISMLVEGLDKKEINSIAEKFIQELDKSNDCLISEDEFVKVMDKVDAENKMSMKF